MLLKVFVISIICIESIDNLKSDCGCTTNREKSKYFEKQTNLNDGAPNDQCHSENLDCIVRNDAEMVLIPAGEYQFGTDDVVIDGDKEGPKRLVKLQSFYLDKYEVSNKDFNIFTESTNYKTEAEMFGDSFVFSLFLNNTFKESLKDFRVLQAPWWYKVDGTNWRHPYGPDSNISGN